MSGHWDETWNDAVGVVRSWHECPSALPCNHVAEIAVLRAALDTARLELMQDVDPDAIIVGIDAALATAQAVLR